MNRRVGVRGRVVLAVLAVSAVLYSLAGAVGFVQVARVGRNAVTARVNEVLDQLEGSLRAGAPAVRLATPDGVVAVAVPAGAARPASSVGDMRVERQVVVGGASVVLVGQAPLSRLDDSLRALHRGLWTAMPLAVLFTAGIAGLATSRALRPVAAITDLAATIGAEDPDARVPVPDTGDEIEKLAVAVNDMLARIGASVVAQRQFTSDAAHELRTPLMALQAEVELAERGLGPADAAFLRRQAALGRRLGTLVDDLVLLATLDEGPTLERRRLRLGDLVRAEAIAVSDQVEVVDDASEIVADEALVNRLVRNLLTNAVRHAATTVRATVAREGARVWVHVDDDGPGIAADQHQRVFQRFSRLDGARAADRGGAGLGLAIVATVAGRHDGGTAVGIGPLGGARVSVWFPAADRQLT